MHSFLLDLLVDPESKTPLTLEIDQVNGDDEIGTGALYSATGRIFPIEDGIPRFVRTGDQGQRQTQGSFAFKWQQEHTYASASSLAVYGDWLVKKYGFGSLQEMQDYLGSRPLMLDAGCGSGYSASIFIDKRWHLQSQTHWVGVDISEAVDVARRRLGITPYMHYVQGDVLEPPFKERSFDVIFSEGVLHHTPSTELAIKALAPLLAIGGEFMFYVYCKKGPIREFSDDYIRNLIADLPPEQAWRMLQPLTQLGKALSDLHAEVEVPEDIPYLGINAGRHDVQRLIYWHFIKLFWNDAYTFDENQHINFDWYHPRYAHRQTEDEVRRWCKEANLTIAHCHVEESGITVRATRKA